MKRLSDMKKKIDVEIMRQNNGAEFRFNEDRYHEEENAEVKIRPCRG